MNEWEEYGRCYWPVDVMAAAVKALNVLDWEDGARSEALVLYSAAATVLAAEPIGAKADNRIPVPAWLVKYMGRTGIERGAVIA